MSTKLFIGSLPWSVNDAELKTLFEPYGNVQSAKVITDKQTRRSKGYGFVEFETAAEASAAINALNDTEVKGRKIIVSEAKPKN
ncbi:MAG: RNA-binding protein [Ignavibacterium sp.]|nr:RNA-binding protein [Ignavibacterium sp.]MCX7610152.1 RNA-binding protein [Ignavibacterium sp.]MDW8375337.1 RNA-binding protein [Ignavibacteriales bacterium]